jgi:hypothetical protein
MQKFCRVLIITEGVDRGVSVRVLKWTLFMLARGHWMGRGIERGTTELVRGCVFRRPVACRDWAVGV